MADIGYACRITRRNFPAIASEKPDFDLNELLDWITKNNTGYFLRDPGSIFDCKYLRDAEFFKMYIFDSADKRELFRRVLRI